MRMGPLEAWFGEDICCCCYSEPIDALGRPSYMILAEHGEHLVMRRHGKT